MAAEKRQAAMAAIESTPRAVLRTVLIVVSVVLTIYVIYLLRKPLSWIVIAGFLAIAVSGPVAVLQKHIPRGAAIALVYLILVAVPLSIAAVLIPEVVGQGEDLVNKAPEYAQDATDFVNKNDTLKNLNDKYNITDELQNQAKELPSKIGDAASVLKDIGVGIVSSIFAGVTILVLSIFMVSSAPRWRERMLSAQPPERAERLGRALDHIGTAVGNYVGGVLLQATLAAVCAFIVLTILGAPFAGALALVIFFFDLIPVVGATIAAVIVGIVMLFVNFPIALIIWVIYAIVYQQVENYVIQPQIQRRATAIEPFVVLVAVLFGATLFGIPGAILAIPTAASLQIAVREYTLYRREVVDPSADRRQSPSGGSGEAAAPA
jgi:predicted PurR-regulated permease PerM